MGSDPEARFPVSVDRLVQEAERPGISQVVVYHLQFKSHCYLSPLSSLNITQNLCLTAGMKLLYLR